MLWSTQQCISILEKDKMCLLSSSLGFPRGLCVAAGAGDCVLLVVAERLSLS